MTTSHSPRILIDNRFRFWLSVCIFLVSCLFVAKHHSSYLLASTLLFLLYSAFIGIGQFEAKRGKAGNVLQYGLLATDIIFITLMIHLTGDFDSPLYIAYAIVFANCLYHQSLSQFVYASVLSFLLYSGLTFWTGFDQISFERVTGQIALLAASTTVLYAILRHLRQEKQTNDRLVSMSQTLSQISDTLSGSLTNSREAIRVVSDLIEKEMGPYGLKCRISIQKPENGFNPPSGGRTGTHIPILGGEYIFGTLMVSHENGTALRPLEQNFFSSLARSLGLHLHRSKIWEDLQKHLEKIEETFVPPTPSIEKPIEMRRRSDWDQQNVREMIEVVKRERGRWTMGKSLCDFQKIFDEELATAQVKAERREQHLHIVKGTQEIPQVAGDEHRLRQLMAHLLLHSILGSAAQADINVSLRAEDRELQVLIEDQVDGGEAGPLPLSNEENSNNEEPGSGTPYFGLVICKNIVEAHRGSMTAESKGPNQGRLFKFTLPLEPIVVGAPAGL